MVSSNDAVNESLKALSDTTRRQILGLLKTGQLSVLEIAAEFPMSRPAISKHLRILKQAGLVLETPAGRQRLYGLELGPLQALQVWLAGFNGSAAKYSPTVRNAGSASRRDRPRVSPRRPGGTQDWRVW